jgi:putative transposase
MPLLLSQPVPKIPEVPVTEGSLALARTDEVSSSLRLVDGVRELVSAEDLAAVLAPCESAGVHGQATRPNRDLAWHKSLFARACWEERERSGCKLEDACAMVAIMDDRRWRLVKPTSRKYGNVRRWITKLGKRKGVPIWGDYGKLVKGRGGGRKSSLEPEFLRRFFRVWLRQVGPNMKAVLDGLAVEFRRVGRGELVPSYDALASYVRSKAPADVIAKYRSPKGQWGDKFMGFVRRRCNCEVGDVIFGDHRIADIWVKATNDQGEWVAVRPYMTAWMDARSGYVTAATMYTAEHPNHRSILDAFLLHVRNCGNRVPSKVYVDNGADFLFRGFSRPVRLARKRGKEILADSEGEPYDYCVLDALGVELMTAAPYNGQEKPVERLFLDFARGWEQPWAPGYTGNSPRNRPDQLLTWKGDVDRLPTLQQAQDDLNYWIETIGHERIREEGRTRGEMWREADFGHLVEFTETDLQYRMLELTDGQAKLLSLAMAQLRSGLNAAKAEG